MSGKKSLVSRWLDAYRRFGFIASAHYAFQYVSTMIFGDLWVRQFHRLWYYSGVCSGQTKWLGVNVFENPMDMWVLQEIIFETRPDFLVETGTAEGGSSLFFANMFDLLGGGRVITIDIQNRSEVRHPRITKLTASSISPETIRKVEQLIGSSRSMVFLDSAHNKEHVLNEMESYKRFVARGCYMVVADSNVNGHPVMPRYSEEIDGRTYRGGPMEAIEEFLVSNPDFSIDKSREKLLFTFFPNGFLLRR